MTRSMRKDETIQSVLALIQSLQNEDDLDEQLNTIALIKDDLAALENHIVDRIE